MHSPLSGETRALFPTAAADATDATRPPSSIFVSTRSRTYTTQWPTRVSEKSSTVPSGSFFFENQNSARPRVTYGKPAATPLRSFELSS